jgi:hypothetical protein
MLVGGVVAVLVVITTAPSLVRFSSESVFDLGTTLAPFILVALLIERATEVVVKGARMQKKVELKKTNPDANRLQEFKADTRKITFLTSFIGGTALAMAGVRIISAFLADDAQFAMGEAQRSIFLSLDVLVTGLVLAGGADGLHKLVSVGTEYLDKAKQNLSQDSGSA